MRSFTRLVAAVAMPLFGCGEPALTPQDEGGNTGGLRVAFDEVELEGEPTQITDFAFYPGSDDFLTLSKDGSLRRYQLESARATLQGRFPVDGVHDEGDCGALSLAFDPGGGYLYIGACVSNQGSQITRLSLTTDGDPVPGSEAPIIYVGHEAAERPWHNVGSIGFEPGGVMWALFGDKAQRGSARDAASHLGKLLRLLPSREPGLGGYEPAPDNPRLADASNPEVYALGLRSPFRGSRDSRGFFWIGDVGGDDFEEVNVVVEPGTDLGWSDFEGPCTACSGSSPPLLYWSQAADDPYLLEDREASTTMARVAWAGPEISAHDPDRYDGALVGSVLFGDFCAGFLRHGRVDDTGALVLDAPLGHLANASAFRQHEGDGYVYAASFGRCEVSKDNPGDEPHSRLFRMVTAPPDGGSASSRW